MQIFIFYLSAEMYTESQLHEEFLSGHIAYLPREAMHWGIDLP